MTVQNLTDSVDVVAERLYNLFVANATLLGLDTGATAPETNVWFGDQDMIPRSPALCIEPGPKKRSQATPMAMTENELNVYLLVYWQGMTDGQQKARKDCIKKAEAIEAWLHKNHLNLQNAAGEQIVIWGNVTDLDPGYVYKQGTLTHSVQMVWTATTKTSLINTPTATP